MENKSITEKAADLLSKVGIINLASIDENGFPRPVPVAVIKAQGIQTIYIATGTSSHKTAHFIANPKAGASFYADHSSVVLTGMIEIIADIEIKKSLWQDWLFEHFPKGVDDPEYCLLKFTSQTATYLIADQFIREEL